MRVEQKKDIGGSQKYSRLSRRNVLSRVVAQRRCSVEKPPQHVFLEPQVNGAWSRVCSMAWRLANISLATGLRITFANFEAGRVPSRVSYKAVLSFGSALLLSQSAPRARFATRNGRAIALSGKDSEFERRPSQVTVLFCLCRTYVVMPTPTHLSHLSRRE